MIPLPPPPPPPPPSLQTNMYKSKNDDLIKLVLIPHINFAKNVTLTTASKVKLLGTFPFQGRFEYLPILSISFNINLHFLAAENKNFGRFVTTRYNELGDRKGALASTQN